jgi:lactoylglutathione lyase
MSLLLRKTLNNVPIKYFFSTTIEKRPFRILGLQQIAIGSLKKDDLSMFWENLLGIEKIGTYQSNKENVDEDILKLGKGLNSIEIDLMQPINPDVSPKVHIPALNHIGLWVDNLSIAYSYLENKGIKFTPGGIRKGASGYDVAFIHPKSAVGVLVELVQAPQDVINHLK